MYRVRLQQFEGPLDLLLFFIRRDELDVYDIPIARIADEFLEYVRVLETIDLDGVGDFLYMAALLINIKARMLLPAQEMDEEGEPIDPRRELVERLLEYVRFKEASQALSERFEDRAGRFTRGMASAERSPSEQEQEELLEHSVFDLISALRRVLTEAPDEPVHTVEPEEYSIEEQSEYVLATLTLGKRQSFSALVQGRTKPFVIATFLAVLELARQGAVALFVKAAEDFYVERALPESSGDGVSGQDPDV